MECIYNETENEDCQSKIYSCFKICIIKQVIVYLVLIFNLILIYFFFYTTRLTDCLSEKIRKLNNNESHSILCDCNVYND